MSVASKLKVLRTHSTSWILKTLIAEFLIRTKLSIFFPMQRGKIKLKLAPTALSRELWVNPGSRKLEEDFFNSYLKQGDLVLDIGANIGCLALLAGQAVGPTGRVLSFEPHPRTFQYLNENIEYNAAKNITTFNMAMGDTSGAIRFSDKSDDSGNQVVRSGGISVPVHRLDDFNLPSGQIALLKIDVEGYELQVLRGAQQVMERVDCIYFEAWDEHAKIFGYEIGDVIQLLNESGFETFRSEERILHLIDRQHRSPQCENLIAVRSVRDFCNRTGWALAHDSARSIA